MNQYEFDRRLRMIQQAYECEAITEVVAHESMRELVEEKDAYHCPCILCRLTRESIPPVTERTN